MRNQILPKRLIYIINHEFARIRFSTFLHTGHITPWSNEVEKMERAGMQSLFKLPPKVQR
jgi:hypothetical protein